MAYYAQPYFPYHRRNGFAPAAHPPHPFGPYSAAPVPNTPAPTFNFFGGAPQYPSPTPSPYPQEEDYEAEERAALAHLRAIQQRREAAQAAQAAQAHEAAQRREAAIRAHVIAQREAAIQAAIEEQRQREQQREAAIREAIQAQRQRQQEREAIQRAIANEREKRLAFARQQQEQQAAFRRRAIEDKLQRRNACAKRCAGACAAQQHREKQENEEENEWEGINQLLGSIFGINLVPETAEATDKPAEPAQAARPAQQPTAAPAPVSPPAEKVETARAPAAKSEQPAEKTESTPAPAPANINDLISHFLGLQVEPAAEGAKSTAGADDLVNNLNEFLGQFGLEFEVEKNGEASNSPTANDTKDKPSASEVNEKKETPAPSASSAPAAAKNDPTPITSFLNGTTNIPPFVRDILSNVELAFNEKRSEEKAAEQEVQGKGKGVAPGEKKVRSTPVPAAVPTPAESAESDTTTSSTASLDKLRDISHDLHLAVESFTFPEHLSFAPSTDEVTPALLFNKGNSKYHAQAHKLLQLLLAADGISSGGDKEVRKQRKAVVKSVEGAIEALEKKRDEIWKEVREKRERGEEESEDEHSSTTSSYASSVVGETEHIESVEATEIAEDPQDVQVTEQPSSGPADESDNAPSHAEVAAPKDEKEQVEGFDVPAATAETAQYHSLEPPTEPETEPEKEESEAKQPTVEHIQDTEAEKTKPEDKEKSEDKEDGYELL